MKALVISVLILTLSAGCQRFDEIPSLPEVEYSFFVAGHVSGIPGNQKLGLYSEFLKAFPSIKANQQIQFGVLTGDVVVDPSQASWDAVDKDLSQLAIPIYIAPGNHDVRNRALYNDRHGLGFRSFIHSGDLFIILDPNLDHWNIRGEQLSFLEQVLADAEGKVDHVFVFFHQLLWWEPDNIFADVPFNSDENRADTLNFWPEIVPLFLDLPSQVYMFAGDVGAFSDDEGCMYYEDQNLTFIASGMGNESTDNFIVADVHFDNTVTFRLIALNKGDIDALGGLNDYRIH